MMTREEVLAEMEASYAQMTEEEKSTPVTRDDSGREYCPTELIQAVRDNTDIGQKYVVSWSQNKEARAQLESLLAALLGGGPLPEGFDLGPEGECDDPDCEVHGTRH